MAMMTEMPVKAVARIVGEHDTRLWRIARHHAERGEGGGRPLGSPGTSACDEKASRRGHSYVTFFADLDERRLLYATEGRKWGVLGEFRADLEAHGGSADSVEELCMDMSPAYIRGARESFPDAEITFDRFHVVRLLNQAVEMVRRTEQKERPELKQSRWLWLSEPRAAQPCAAATARSNCWIRRGSRSTRPGRTSSSCRSRSSGTCPRRWPSAICNDGALSPSEGAVLAPMATVAGTIRAHATGILRWLHSRISNGMLEAMNSLVQAAKVRARGYRTNENFITMAYLVCGKLNFNLPT